MVSTPALTDGSGVQTTFGSWGITFSRSGAFAVVSVGSRIRIINLATLQVTTLAGSDNSASADGQGTMASFLTPEGVALSRDELFVYVGEGFGSTTYRIRRIEVATGIVTTLAGSGIGYVDGVGTLAQFYGPRCIAMYPNGLYLLISDQFNSRIRRLDLTTRAVTTLAAGFNLPYAIAIDATGSYALICDYNNHQIRRLDLASTVVTTLAGSGSSGFQNGVGIGARFMRPVGVSIDPTGAYALVADSYQYIRRIVIATGQVTTLAGTGAASAIDGIGAQATFNSVHAICIDPNGTFALAGDMSNNRIRRIALTSAPCSAGYFCPAGSSSLTHSNCTTAGYFCPAGSSSATHAPCPAGLYCPDSSVPQLCTAGYYCSAVGATSEVRAGPCAIGSYCPAGSSTATQMNCTAGSFCNATGLSSAGGPCLAGYWCGSGSTLAMQNGCPAGAYCPAGSSAPLPCPIGAYCAYAFRGDYEQCPSGTYCRSVGLTAPLVLNVTCSEGCVAAFYFQRLGVSAILLSQFYCMINFPIMTRPLPNRHLVLQQEWIIDRYAGVRPVRGGFLLRRWLCQYARRNQFRR